MSITFEQLDNLSLGALHRAVDAWAATKKRAAELDQDASADVTKPFKAAGWISSDITSSLATQMVEDVDKEFTDAHKVSSAIHSILEETHGKLEAKKKELKSILEEERSRGDVTISGRGEVTYRPKDGADSSGSASEGANRRRAEQDRVDAVVERIERVLKEASEIDDSAAAAIRYNIGRDGNDFHGRTSARTEEAEARYDTGQAVRLARKGDKMSDAELSEFEGILAEHKNDPDFSQRFATRMGGKGTLEFWNDLANLGGSSGSKARQKVLGDIQEDLSSTLATASHGNSPEMKKWKQEVVAAGDDQFDGHSSGKKPYGFQIMSSLMTEGKFDKGFLDDYGKSLMAFEKDKTEGFFGQDTDELWGASNNSMTGAHDFNFSSKGNGLDPMTGFLKASSHNPDYAASLFADEEDAEYLLKDREYFQDVLKDGEPIEGHKPSLDALGDAAFAAGSGMTPEAANSSSSQYVQHSAENDKAFKNVLSTLADSGDDMPPELRDDTSKLLGNHRDETYRSMSAPDAMGAPLDREDLLEVSKQISKAPESYGLLNAHMNHAAVQDIHTEEKHPEDSLARSGRMVGFMEEARYQATGDEKNQALVDSSWKRTSINGAIAGTVGYVPGAGVAVPAANGFIMESLYQDEVARASKEETRENQSVNDFRGRQMHALKDEWYDKNSDWAEDPSRDGYSKGFGAYDRIGNAADHGKADAREVAGDG